jgi:hypothetical protein
MKAKAEHRDLFDSGGCLTQQAISLFIDNALSDKELKLVEMHTSGCELCAEALEGSKLFKSAEGFNSRVNRMRQSAWRRSLYSSSKSRKLFYGLSSAAASIAILLGVYFILKMDTIMKEEFDSLKVPEIARTEQVEDTLPEKEVSKLTAPESEYIKTSPKASRKETPPPTRTIAETIVIEDDVELDEVDFSLEEHSDTGEYNMEYIVVEEEKDNRAEKAQLTAPLVEEIAYKYEPEAEEDLAVEEAESEESRKGVFRVMRSARKKQETVQLASEATDKKYYMADVTPMFQGGGIENFNKYLADSLKIIIPDSVLVESIVVTFVVDSIGKVDQVKLISGTSSKVLNEKVLQLVKASPSWVPGTIQGHPAEMEQQAEVKLDSIRNLN